MSSSNDYTQTLHPEKILSLIKKDGPLSHLLKGFEVRQSQQDMMANIINAYNKNHIALIEAGTGTGKSLAYLLPALLWASKTNDKTLISTKTIALQEQLVNKDIPQLNQALNLNLKAVLVKGMSNYLCLRKLDETKTELSLFPDQDKPEIDKIEMWSRNTVEGSKSEIPFIPTHSAWERICAESETCTHNHCPFFQSCFFFKARREAQDAHLLVVNYHLLFADLIKRGEDNNYSDSFILPSYKKIILDEAHHIEEIATEYFAHRINRIDLLRILSKISSEKSQIHAGKLPILKDKIQTVFNKAPPMDVGGIISRLTIDLPAFRLRLIEQIHHTFDLFIRFLETLSHQSNSQDDSTLVAKPIEKKLRLLEMHETHPHWTDEILPKNKQLLDQLNEYTQALRSIEADLKSLNHEKLNEQTKAIRLDLQALTLRIEMAISTLNRFFNTLKDPSRVKWIELHQLKSLLNVHLVDADLDVAHALVDFLFSKFSTIILCSATLTTNQQFSYIRERLGITQKFLSHRKITEHVYESPFDYKKQTLLAIPKDMPLPSDSKFNSSAFENIQKAIEASKGNVFVLFTSYQMLEQCAEALKSWLKDHLYPLFKHGDEHRQILLNKFKATPRAVLFGTDSFWEGVDVAGDALRCVIIVKLPFKVPNDPMIQARTEAILESGKDPFLEYSIPQAIVKFKQGFGRLIRQKMDRGCVICLDTRLITKRYGQLFLNSLPECEHLFLSGNELWPKIQDFYRKTYYLVNQNPFK